MPLSAKTLGSKLSVRRGETYKKKNLFIPILSSPAQNFSAMKLENEKERKCRKVN